MFVYISESLQICKIHLSQWTRKGENIHPRFMHCGLVSLQLFDHLMDTKTATIPSHVNARRTFHVN